MNELSGVTLFCKITHSPNIFMIYVHKDSLGIIKVILEWPTPPSIREIWGFNDLTNFYKRFVPYFSILVAPLIELVRNYVLSWEDGQERGFQSLPYSNIRNITNTYVFILFTGCRNLPFGGRATRDSRDACSTKGIRAESPPTFI